MQYLGIVPSGTRNVLTKSLNLPTGDLECCKHFVGSKTQKIDVISATATNPSIAKHPMTQPRIFLNAAEIGVGAEIIDRSKRVKEKVKSRIVSTISSVVITLPTYTSKLCEIFIDDGRGTNNNILTKMTMCVIANGKYPGRRINSGTPGKCFRWIIGYGHPKKFRELQDVRRIYQYEK